jgi:hypothetical protein
VNFNKLGIKIALKRWVQATMVDAKDLAICDDGMMAPKDLQVMSLGHMPARRESGPVIRR